MVPPGKPTKPVTKAEARSFLTRIVCILWVLGSTIAEAPIVHDAPTNRAPSSPPLPPIQLSTGHSRFCAYPTSFPTLPGTVFFFFFKVVEEGWLVRWRKFVLGRGARRYHAPGEMDNRPLLVGPDTPRNVCERARVGQNKNLSLERILVNGPDERHDGKRLKAIGLNVPGRRGKIDALVSHIHGGGSEGLKNGHA